MPPPGRRTSSGRGTNARARTESVSSRTNELSREQPDAAKQGSWTRERERADRSERMFSWVRQEQGGRNKEGEMYQTVTEGLQSLYSKKLLPLEDAYLFHDFHSPALEPADFQSKPMVLLVGQYSTGKTTFIRYRPAAAGVSQNTSELGLVLEAVVSSDSARPGRGSPEPVPPLL